MSTMYSAVLHGRGRVQRCADRRGAVAFGVCVVCSLPAHVLRCNGVCHLLPCGSLFGCTTDRCADSRYQSEPPLAAHVAQPDWAARRHGAGHGECTKLGRQLRDPARPGPAVLTVMTLLLHCAHWAVRPCRAAPQLFVVGLAHEVLCIDYWPLPPPLGLRMCYHGTVHCTPPP